MALIYLNSCNDSKNKNLNESNTNTQLESEQEKLKLDINSDSILTKWVEYYKEKKPSFSLSNFYLITTDSLILIQGTVFGSFDNNFDKVYHNFLIYRLDKKQYLDLDSYNWTIDENGQPSFSPDQEINLIDIENKTVNRIAFRGPSQWVEDAFWKNDSTIVLLENNYEKQPIFTELNLKNKLVRIYKYNETLNLESDYTMLRFKQKGITNE